MENREIDAKQIVHMVQEVNELTTAISKLADGKDVIAVANACGNIILNCAVAAKEYPSNLATMIFLTLF